MSNKYKCHICQLIILNEDRINDKCPVCHNDVVAMCEDDHCHCIHEVTSGLAYCEKCGKGMCPICKCHDISQISRVTGYLGELSGFNHGKQQEVKDRTRHDPFTGSIIE